MLFTPPFSFDYWESNCDTPSANPGTSVTTASTALGKSSETPTELIASTSKEALWVAVFSRGYGASATASGGFMDIMLGAAASESVLIPNLMIGNCQANPTCGNLYCFPLRIPAGSRLSCRAQGERTSTAFRVGIFLLGMTSGRVPFPVGSSITAYGPDPGTSNRAVAITLGGSAAEGSWTQVVASTIRDHFYLFPGLQHATDSSTTISDDVMEIGVGAATEHSLGINWHWQCAANEMQSGPFPQMGAWRGIPSGSRLTMRGSTEIITPDLHDCAIYAVS